MTDIKIDRLKINLIGVSPETARAMGNGMGKELLNLLVLKGIHNHKNGRISINTLNCGTVQSKRPAASHLRGEIVHRIVGAIGSSIKK